MQIERAKRLIEKGNPGAALEILENSISDIDSSAIDSLKIMVSRFNIKAEETASSTTNPNTQSEFEPEAAANRIVDALDLIEIFFENENYIQGITLLTAAQETFLKAAIIYLVNQIEETVKITDMVKLRASELIAWDNRGLFLKSKQDIMTTITRNNVLCQISSFDSFPDAHKNLSLMLSFIPPRANYDEPWSNEPDRCGDYPNWPKYLNMQNNASKKWTLKNVNDYKTDRYFEINSQRSLKWLRNFNQLKSWKPWELLNWIGTYEREREDDKRNQLMHNLRGVKKEDVIRYLKGNPSDDSKLKKSNNVVEVYCQDVKQPFRNALADVGLWNDRSTDNKLKTELKELAKQLS